MKIGLLAAFGHDAHVAVAHGLQRRTDDFLGVHEPLIGQHRLDHHLGAVTKGLHDRLGFDQRDRQARTLRIRLQRRLAKTRIIRTGHHGQTFGSDLLNHAGAGLHPLQPAQVIRHEVERVDLGTIEGVAFGDLLRARGADRVILAVIAQMRRAIH